MKVDKVLFCALVLMCLILPETLALTVSTDKVDYIAGDSVDVGGIAPADDLNVIADIYNSTNDLISSSIINTSGDSPNYFSTSIPIDGTYTQDTYHLSITSSSEQINTTFNVLSEFLSIKASIIGSQSVKVVDTSYLVTGISNYSSNFSEVFSQSLSGTLHFGNISNLTGDGKDYSFVLVDDKSSGTYDTVYIDRNSTFTGIWKVRHAGETIGKNINYTIKEIEYSTGNKIILSPSTSIDDASYSDGETIYLLAWAKNETHLKSGTNLNISVVDNDDNIESTKTGSTNSQGYFITNVTAPTDVGTYYIKINGKPTEMFSVETFRLVGKITDLAGNPTYTLSKNPKLFVSAKVKAVNGDTIRNATVTAQLVYPNGTATNLGSLSFDNNTNDYTKEVDLSKETTTGKYKVIISALYEGDTQEFLTGFETESVKLEILAINPQFMEDAEGPEAMVDSFAPGAKVSLIVMLSDSSSGSIMESGPESMGLIDIDNQSTGEDECKTRLNLISVIDENGASLNLSTLNFSTTTGIMNLSSAIEVLQAGEDSGPEDAMLSQCMIIFDAPAKTGVYKATARVKHPAGEKEAVSTFSVQKLYATANPVDFKGEDFWFYAPNSSINIKIKVTDLLTRGDIPAGNITDAKIIEMYKVWPSYEDVLSDEAYSPAASAANGTITFTSHSSEGFFMFRFRFTAYVSGEVQYGTGNGYFMLKKYMIWGEPAGCERGSACISAEGDNINLTVYIVDIDKGSMMDLGKSGLTCDDKNNDGLSDCDGFDVDISELWNDQLMKKMEKGTDYNVNKTSIRSSNATLSIEPVNLPTGWYHIDLIITDHVTKDTYFGWAWFEIRNFWIDIMPLNLNENGNLTASQEKGRTYGVGKSILFTATAFDPKNKDEFGHKPLNLSAISLESISMKSNNGPPTSLENNTDYIYTISNRKVSMPWEPPESEPWQMKVINLTLLVNKTGQYAANFRVTTKDGDSDIGEMWFEVSRFVVDITHNGGKNDWLVSFSPTQIAEINVTAYDFDMMPVNLSANDTKIRSFWNEKTMHPIKPLENSTNVSCTGNACTLTADLSKALPAPGKYYMLMDIADADGNKKQAVILFETRDIIVSIPNMKEIWIGEQDTTKRELNLRNDRDRCSNDRQLNDDQLSRGQAVKWLNDESQYGVGLQSNDCPAEPNKACLWGSNLNLTFESEAPSGSLNGTAFCLLNNGLIDDGNVNASCSGRIIYAVSNGSLLWLNLSDVAPEDSSGYINMTGIAPNMVLDVVNTGNRIWTIVNIFENGFQYADNKLLQDCYPGGECNNIVMPEKNTSFPHKARKYCVNATDWTFFDNATYCPPGMQNVHIVSNTTHVWAGNTTNLTSANPKVSGTSLSGSFIGSENWKVLDIRRSDDGSANDNAVRIVPLWTYNIIDTGGIPAINVSMKYSRNTANAFCIRPNGEWDYGNGICEEEGTSAVFVVSNSTHLWVSNNSNVIGANPKAIGESFTIGSKTWTVISAGLEQNNFAVKNADGICGEFENSGEGYTMIPPSGHENYTTIYHGYINNLIQNLEQNNDWFLERYPDFNETRGVYIYHNTTHLWMSNSTDLSAEAPHAINDIISDTYGGLWKLTTINRNSVTLRGENVLASTGAYINTSLSKSGIIKITSMEEERLGGWDKEQGREVGIDLNGDGRKNSTVYFALSDSEIKGVYDTMFYSKNNNFSNAISVNGNRQNRTFGESEKLTLLSISPDARKIQAYGQKTGDWGDLGELKIGTNVKIPIIVRSPSGEFAAANVSVEIIKAKTGSSSQDYPDVLVNGTINGIGELVVNLTSATGSSASGRYTFGLAASQGSSEKEILEEWMWPFVTMRSFLSDIYVGDAGYISGLREVPLTNYRQNEYGGWIPELYTINETGNPEIYGVMLHADNSNIICTIVPPSDADTGNFTVVKSWQPFDNIYLGIDATNQTVYTNPTSDCNFTRGDESGPSHLHDPINLTFNSRQYMLEVLEIITTPGYNRTSLGISGINPAEIEPIKTGQFGPDNNPSPKWRLMSLDLSGTAYNVILAEDTPKESPMCTVWNMDECAKKAWFDTDGNFTDAVGTSIGDNFTSDLYLARVGPGSWEGIVIGNSSNINYLAMPKLPGIDVEVTDNTVSRFAIVNESLVGLDLNLNDETNNTFYMVVYDDRYDGLSNLTSITVDDDLNITQEWWQDADVNYDFYGSESGAIKEQRGSLPNSIWSGNVRFANDMNTNWQIEIFNNTDMLVRKSRDGMNPFSTLDDVTLVLRAYNFDQTSISAANVSVERIMYFSMGAVTLSPSQYSVSISNSNKTTDTGHVIVTISPVGTWQRGEYMAQIKIDNNQVTERKTEWFRVGN